MTILEQLEEAMMKLKQIQEAMGAGLGEGKRRGPSPGDIRIIWLWVCSQSRRLMTQRVGRLYLEFYLCLDVYL